MRKASVLALVLAGAVSLVLEMLAVRNGAFALYGGN